MRRCCQDNHAARRSCSSRLSQWRVWFQLAKIRLTTKQHSFSNASVESGAERKTVDPVWQAPGLSRVVSAQAATRSCRRPGSMEYKDAMKSFIGTIAGMAMAASLIGSDTQLTTTPSALQGTWRLTSLNGRSIPPQGPQITLSIVGEKYQQAVDGKVTERGTLKLDASKQPMTIDLAITEGDDSGKAQIGIVEVTDGTLRMCLDTPGAGQRPSEFGVKDGVIVFEARKNEL